MVSVAVWVVVVFALLVLAALVGIWLSWTAGRLDRVHIRSEQAYATLEAHAGRRAALATEIALSGAVDPASAVLLLDAVAGTHQPPSRDDWDGESDLTDVLLTLELTGSPRHDELVEACRRLTVARRIHNDLAATAEAFGKRRRVRWFRLAGHADPVRPVDFDDRVPT